MGRHGSLYLNFSYYGRLSSPFLKKKTRFFSNLCLLYFETGVLWVNNILGRSLFQYTIYYGTRLVLNLEILSALFRFWLPLFSNIYFFSGLAIWFVSWMVLLLLCVVSYFYFWSSCWSLFSEPFLYSTAISMW